MDVSSIAAGLSEVPSQFNFVADIVEQHARRRPDAPALWWVSETGCECRYTFEQIARKGRKASAFLHDMGIRKGDRVIVILQRVPQWWFAMLGLVRLGAVPIPGTPLLTAKDIAYRLEYSEARAIITDADGAAKVEHLRLRLQIHYLLDKSYCRSNARLRRLAVPLPIQHICI